MGELGFKIMGFQLSREHVIDEKTYGSFEEVMRVIFRRARARIRSLVGWKIGDKAVA